MNIEILEQTRYKNTGWQNDHVQHWGITLLCIRVSANPWKEEPSFTILNRTKAKRGTRMGWVKEEAGQGMERARGLRCWILSTITDRVVSVSLHVRATTLTDAFFSTTPLTSSTTYTGWSKRTPNHGTTKLYFDSDTFRSFSYSGSTFGKKATFDSNSRTECLLFEFLDLIIYRFVIRKRIVIRKFLSLISFLCEINNSFGYRFSEIRKRDG